jgi:hypothetical protein
VPRAQLKAVAMRNCVSMTPSLVSALRLSPGGWLVKWKGEGVNPTSFPVWVVSLGRALLLLLSCWWLHLTQWLSSRGRSPCPAASQGLGGCWVRHKLKVVWLYFVNSKFCFGYRKQSEWTCEKWHSVECQWNSIITWIMQTFQRLTWKWNGKAEALFMHVIKNYLLYWCFTHKGCQSKLVACKW